MNPLILLDVAGRIAERLVQNPSVPVERTDKIVVQQQAAEVLRQEVAPVIEHLTNNEPAVKSRVTQGAVGAITLAAGVLLYSWSKGTLNEEIVSTQIGVIVSSLWVLYGRWKATKPFGA